MQSAGAAAAGLFDNRFDPIEAGCEEPAGAAGYRHGSRTRVLMGTFGLIEIKVPGSPGQGCRWHDPGMEQRGVAGLPASQASRRGADRLNLFWPAPTPAESGGPCLPVYNPDVTLCFEKAQKRFGLQLSA